jgi:XTP/dITP diphosphohydrolase
MVYVRHAADPVPLIAQDSWEGRILTERHGEGGFGYDPVFFVPEHGCSAAELSADQKNAISHRGKALNNMLQQLTQIYV